MEGRNCPDKEACTGHWYHKAKNCRAHDVWASPHVLEWAQKSPKQLKALAAETHLYGRFTTSNSTEVSERASAPCPGTLRTRDRADGLTELGIWSTEPCFRNADSRRWRFHTCHFSPQGCPDLRSSRGIGAVGGSVKGARAEWRWRRGQAERTISLETDVTQAQEHLQAQCLHRAGQGATGTGP